MKKDKARQISENVKANILRNTLYNSISNRIDIKLKQIYTMLTEHSI